MNDKFSTIQTRNVGPAAFVVKVHVTRNNNWTTTGRNSKRATHRTWLSCNKKDFYVIHFVQSTLCVRNSMEYKHSIRVGSRLTQALTW